MKMIAIAAAAGVVSFAGAFATGRLTRPAPVTAESPDGAVPQPSKTGESQAQVLTPALSPGENAGTRAMTEQQLKELVNDLRDKMKQYDEKLKSLEKDKERLQMAQQGLKKDIETLNNLRVDIATTAAGVKTERDQLLKARVEVEQTEKANLKAIASAYDKMDATRAGEILRSMAMGQSKGRTEVKSANMDDAIKILHFMQDRTKAKVLAEMAANEPTLAATLCQKLKQVTETK